METNNVGIIFHSNITKHVKLPEFTSDDSGRVDNFPSGESDPKKIK